MDLLSCLRTRLHLSLRGEDDVKDNSSSPPEDENEHRVALLSRGATAQKEEEAGVARSDVKKKDRVRAEKSL